MFENPRRGRQATNFTRNDPKILDLKSSSEQIIFRKLSLGAPEESDITRLVFTFMRRPHMLNIIPRRFIYSGVGSSVGLLGTGLYRNILFGLLGSSLGEEMELPAGILIECIE